MSEWESVTEEKDEDACLTECTERLRVPGGWLYKTSEMLGDEWTQQVTFIADKDAK